MLVLDGIVHIEARRTAASARCPACRRRSEQVHSRYTRRITDEPVGGRPVVVHLRVRRFLCPNRSCSKQTFAEQLPALAARSARRSVPLRADLQQTGVALGGRPGARLSAALQRPVSRTTLLRLVRALPLPAAATPRVLGVDDWARRKQHRYGTILVDLERQRVIDLLPDRTAETLASWLRDRPGVQIVSRDRSGAYADGVAQGAPEAMQIADRFHLTRNLVEMLDRFFDRHRAMIKQVERPDALRPDAPAPPSPVTAAPPSPSLEAERERKRVARQARYVEVRERYLKGARISELARELKLNWRTVRKYAQADQCPERRPAPRRPRLLTPYEPYLRRRWADGCHNAMRLHREIVAQGFGGSRIHVARFVTHLRRAPAAAPTAAITPAQVTARGLTPRDATWLVLRRAPERTPAEQAALDQLAHLAPEVERLVTFGERFLALLRERQGTLACARWVTDAAAAGVPELRRFIIKLKQDLPAVQAACREDWSNGQTEGQVTRLKLVKRQMFGRASFDLLLRRLLLAS
jgi:transposase